MGTRSPGTFSSLFSGLAKGAVKGELKKEGNNLATLVAGSAPLHHMAVGKVFLMALTSAHPIGLLGAIAVGTYAIYKGIKKYEETKSVREAIKTAGVTPERIGEFSSNVAIAHTEIKNSVIPQVYSNIRPVKNIKEIRTIVYNVLES